MTTNMDPSKYTLIYYRPNGERYEGCGDYTRFDSELECFQGVTREEMLQTIVEKTKHASSCCGSCPQSENACEFAILKDGKPLVRMGSNLHSFDPDSETYEATDEYFAVNNIFDEAAEVIEQEHKAAAEAAEKAKAEAAAKKAVADAEAARARLKAAEEAERRQYETLKAKYEPKPEPVPEPLVKAVEKAKAELATVAA